MRVRVEFIGGFSQKPRVLRVRDGASVHNALDELGVLDGDALKTSVRVLLNGRAVGHALVTPLKDGDVITVASAVAGG
jgi:sulfur carrier protein ThiS